MRKLQKAPMVFDARDFTIETNYSKEARKKDLLKITLKDGRESIEVLSSDIILAIVNSYNKEAPALFGFHQKQHPMVDVERTLEYENQLYDKDGNPVPKHFNYIQSMTLESAVIEHARGLCGDIPTKYYVLTSDILRNASKELSKDAQALFDATHLCNDIDNSQ